MPPMMLVNSLRAVRRRVRVLGVMHGVGIVATCAVGLLLATVLLDYVLNLPAAPRVALMAMAIGVVFYAVMRWVLRPAFLKLPLGEIAGRLEQAFPQFNDRLRSTVDFLRGDVPGSQMMQQRVVDEAAALAGRLDLGTAVNAAPAWHWFGGGVAAIALCAMLAAVAGQQYLQIALSRLLTPFDAQAWPRRVHIELLAEVPARVPVGQKVDVRMKLSRGDSPLRKATIFYQYDDGPVQQELMLRGGDGVYAASLDARLEPGRQAALLRIWMKAGDDERSMTPITVVPRLAIKSVEAAISPPPYVRSHMPTTVNLAAAPAVVADGSRIALRVGFNKPLAADADVELIPAARDAVVAKVRWQRDTNAAVIGTWTSRQSLRFHIRATDIDGFANNAAEEFEIVVRPDQSPSVQIENPRRNEERTAVSVVPLAGMVEDDYGIDWLKLIVERIGDKKQWEIPLIEAGAATNQALLTRPGASTDRVRLGVSHQWDLAQLADAQLKSGDVLEYHLLAQDNFALDGQTHEPVASGRLRITIISQEDLASRIIEELRQVKNQILGVKNAQQRTHQETAALARETSDKPQLDGADQAALQRLTNQQATGASQARQIAARVESLQQRLTENKSPARDLADIARDVRNDLDQAAEGAMKDAASRLSQADQQDATPQARNESLEKAQANQQEAEAQLQRALDRMANIGSLQQTIQRLKDILTEQLQISRETRDVGKQNLGRTPAQMTPADRERLNKAADAQQKLAEQTAKAIDEMNKLAEQMAKSDAAASEAMRRAAQTGRQQQVPANQQKAAQQTRQNQQAQAQAAQKQVELGLELMLNELRQAERHKLAELSRRLAELQDQIANLIRRQAGHNLDNLTHQGPARLARMESSELAGLLSKAQRTGSELPPVPQLPQLSAFQAQTERNTRDIARMAEDMPNGAEPAMHLTRAASRMERAVVLLRDRMLPDAYEPPQVEALLALEQARNIVDEQKSKVDEQIEDQDQEAIRQKYVKIKEDQEKLNAETARIDESRRAAEGVLARADAVRLGLLPGEQGKLADRIEALTDDLAAVGSTVYIWANKDIADSMNDVKDALGRHNTAASTQAEQARVVEQLEAMIRNLAVKPRQSKYAQEGGGSGGQCNGGPMLPAEAELRLLQDLQRAINKSTEVLDAQVHKDKPRLLVLGNRQGELRNLLNELLRKSSGGQVQLGPEPDNRDQLPEEARPEDIDNQELQKNLLNDVPDERKNQTKAGLIGDRMARVRQRLALNLDPGKVTQMIEQRIIEDLDYLIDQARLQQAQTRNAQRQPAQRMRGPKPGQMAQAQSQGSRPGTPRQTSGATPAGQSAPPGQAEVAADLSKEIRETAAEWGAITPRLRDAVIEGASENIVEEYRKFVEDYYRSVASRGAGTGE